MKTICSLRWHEDLQEARAAARRNRRPILSLRLLGRLDEEQSCANSRFFRTTLYPSRVVRTLLADRFVLHWRSVRPVPRVTIDFGDGRRLERTLTGNSAHLVLDDRGRPVDALPGLYDANRFARLASAAADLATDTVAQDGDARRARLASWHAARHDALLRAWARDLRAAGARAPDAATPAALAAATGDADWERIALLHAPGALPDAEVRDAIARSLPPPAATAAPVPDAHEAGRLAPTKRAVEQPLLDVLLPLARTIAEDTARNEYDLHRRVHERFSDASAPAEDADALTAWVYADLFKMPPEDPWLGLRAAAFAATQA
jgi:hypothetical protein